ncbi:MAG: hypothetical protein RIQ89_1841, partial [Bacteroidota bacterium]
MKRIGLILFNAMLASFTAYSQSTFPINGVSDYRSGKFAFYNGTVFIDYKTKIDSATLVIADGKVASINAKGAIPIDAVPINLNGSYIYPSFIDIFADFGMPELKEAVGKEDPQFITSKDGAYNWNEAIKPEQNAFEVFKLDLKNKNQYLSNGFGIVLSAIRDGVARGTATLATVTADREHLAIIEPLAATSYSFDKGSSTQDYPSSLMGSIALLRQTFYDAQWYAKGGAKLEYNLSLDALVKSSSLPAIFEANDKANALRADRLGDEFGIQFIIKGGGNEYQSINEIKQTNATFIIPINFPNAYNTSDPVDLLDVSLEAMKHWELAPTNAAALYKSGINFCFTSADLKNKNDFLKNLRKAVLYGLPEQEALKALLLNPAKALQMENKLGTLNKGVVANFFIADKNIFAKDVTVSAHWLQGKVNQLEYIPNRDIRGQYITTIDSHQATIKISGKKVMPEVMIEEDTFKIKSTFTWGVADQFTISWDSKLAKKNIKINASQTSTDQLAGLVYFGDGLFDSFTAIKQGSYEEQQVKEASKIDTFILGKVIYPFSAFGNETAPMPNEIIFKDATVWTNEADGIINGADVWIANGVIKSVGKNLTSPTAMLIDANGKHLTAGIIDEHSHIAASGGVNEGTQSSSAEVRISDIINPEDINIYRQLSGGVTTSHILHGSANAIGGQTQLIKLKWGASAEAMKFTNWPGFIKFALGENVKQSNWGDKQTVRFPQSRMGVEQVYLDYFNKAKKYEATQKLFVSQKGQNLPPPRRDLELEALVEIINGKRFITCHSYVQSEINMLMKVAEIFNFKVNTFTHILEGYKVA